MERLWEALDRPVGLRPAVAARVTPYVYAVILVILGVVCRLALGPVLGDQVVFLFFVPALLIAAATGGLAPGLTATALSVGAGLMLLSRYRPVVGNGIDGVVFACLGVAIAVGGQRLRAARSHAAEMTRHVLDRQAHLASILDTVPDAMVVTDEEGFVQSFSPVAEILFQWSKEEVVGQNFLILVTPSDRETLESDMERRAAAGEGRTIGLRRILTGQRKDGSTFPLDLFVGVTNANGHRFFTGFVRDLTERHTADARLQELQAELLHVSRLSAMGEMASSLAHELNQPLSAISNYLRGGRRLLEAENRDSRALPAMEKAADQALRAGEIIRRLRNFVAGSEGDRSEASLNGLLEEASELGLVGAHERSIDTHVELSPAIDAVVVDRIQIQQVVLNLLRNAMEAMKDSPRRELHLASCAADDGMAMVSVADTGSGISPEIADRLFKPFVTTKGGQGMGVGLSICRGIIEAHGGHIWTEPNPSGGAIFRFTLPRVNRKVEYEIPEKVVA
ncbi:MAG TPA: ATP-binding protein [Caulobacteraceae bacterium]|jgi:two-component system sensor kinase FixL|nr:ATP-binding protein [Caulobacteraceae bacterium]